MAVMAMHLVTAEPLRQQTAAFPLNLGVLPGGHVSDAYAVNNNGLVAGVSTVPGSVIFRTHAFVWTQATGMIDIGTLSGPTGEARAEGVSDSGLVVGSSSVGSTTRAFLWSQAGGMLDLGTLGSSSGAGAVNNNGMVVGGSAALPFPLNEAHAFAWTQLNGMIDLGTLGGSSSEATALNDSGLVIGRSKLAGQSSTNQAFVWTETGGMIPLTLGGPASIAAAVNENGMVVGRSQTSANGTAHAFVWTESRGIVDLGTLGGTASWAEAVNDNGLVVGSFDLSASGPRHGFLWTEASGIVDLGPAWGPGGTAVGVNNSGVVVGFNQDGSVRRPFVWTQGNGRADLGTLGGSSGHPSAISDRGMVVGSSGNRAVVWALPSATLVSETGPQGTLLPGQSYTKTWTLRNTGSMTWAPGFSLQYVSGNSGCNHSDVPMVGSVAPNATYTFAITCTAPTSLGTHREDWRFLAPTGWTVLVGSSPTLWTQISVTDAVRLEFGSVTSPQTAGVTFSVTLRALNAQGSVVSSFAGEVQLLSTIGTVTPTKVNFVAGQAISNVTIGQPAAQVQLVAWLSGVPWRSALFDVTGATLPVALSVVVRDAQSPVAGATVRVNGQPLGALTNAIGIAFGTTPCGQEVLFEASLGSQAGQRSQFVHCGTPLSISLTLAGPTCSPNGRTPVILLPGILGSTTGKKILLPTLPKKGESPDEDWLHWKYEYEHRGALSPGPYGLFDPLWGLSHPITGEPLELGWQSLIDSLVLQGYELGCTMFPAPYDWRLDMDVIAGTYLAPLVERARSRSGVDKVDIIAHSMGGLVARAYIQDDRRAGDTKIRRIALVGTPNSGAVKAYFLWHGGDVREADTGGTLYEDTISYLYKQDHPNGYIRIPNLGIHRARVRDYLRDESLGMPSVRQLLPTFAFLEDPVTHAVRGLTDPARKNQWLEDLNRNAGWFRSGATDFVLEGVEVRLFGGMGEETEERLTTRTDVIYGEDGGPQSVRRPRLGDGTVLLQKSLAPLAPFSGVKIDGQHANLIRAHLYGELGLVKFITGTAAVAGSSSSQVRQLVAGHGVGPAMLDVSVHGPAVALLEQINPPRLATGVTAGLQPVINLPESDLSTGGGETHISLSHPYGADGSGGSLAVNVTMTGTGDYVVAITLFDGTPFRSQEFRFHTSYLNRVLVLRWDDAASSFAIDVGAMPPEVVTAAPSAGGTLLSWSTVTDATGYRVFRRRDGFPTFDLVATVPGDALSWLATDDAWSGTPGVAPAEFAVSAMIGSAESAFSFTVINNDQDGDGLTDVQEASGGTSPTTADTDSDGLTDLSESQIGTNPLSGDSDGDGLSDGLEYRVGSDPLRASVTTGPKPTIAAVVPGAAIAGQAVSLTIEGAGFFDDVSLVRIAGQAVPTTFVNGNQLRVTVPSSVLCPPGSCALTVDNPMPGGGMSAVTTFQVRLSAADYVQNGTFASGLSNWSAFATPDNTYMTLDISSGVLEFTRVAPPAGTSNQATVFQETGLALASGSTLLAQFDLGNTSTARKRISILLLDHDFGDLSVCTFWLPPNSPLRAYAMRTHTTKAWANASIYFYAATTGTDGGAYQIDNVALQVETARATNRTDCIDPTAPAAVPGPDGPDLIGNGQFSSVSLAPWALFGQIVHQLSGGVFEFFRPAGNPAGVVLQSTGQAMAAGEIVEATFRLGNSSSVRKRVTVLLHDSDFSDLAACTFWLAPGQQLSGYVMRGSASRAWANATVSVYAATIGLDQWTRLDDVTLRRVPSRAISGTECLEPTAGVPASSLIAPPVSFSPLGTASANSESTVRISAPAAPYWTLEHTDGSPHTSILRWLKPGDLSSSSLGRLVFESWLSDSASSAEVQVSTDAVSWITVTSVLPSADWQQVEIDLSMFAGQVVHVRFAFYPLEPVDAAIPRVWRLRDIRFIVGGSR